MKPRINPEKSEKGTGPSGQSGVRPKPEIKPSASDDSSKPRKMKPVMKPVMKPLKKASGPGDREKGKENN